MGPVVLAATAMILVLVGVVAGFVPTRQALAVQPIEALRYE